MGGMRAWLREHGGRLDPATTLVLGLDTVGSGLPLVLDAEGGLWPVRYREEDVQLALAGARRARVAARRWRLGGWTDPALARLAGLPSVSLLSVRDGGLPNYHLPSDVPSAVDWGSVRVCIDWAHAIVAEWSGR